MKEFKLISIRVTPSLHKRLAIHLAEQEKKITAYLTNLIEEDLKKNNK